MLPREAVKMGLKEALKNWNEHGPRTGAEGFYRRYWSFFSGKIPDSLSQAAEACYRDARDPAEVADELGVKRKTVTDNASHALGRVTELICGTLSQQKSGFPNAKAYETVTAICENCGQPFETVVDWDFGGCPKHFFCSPVCYAIYRDKGCEALPLSEEVVELQSLMND